MAKKKQKYYVVWQGIKPGIYTSWEECSKQINGFPGAKYKSFEVQSLAEEAYRLGPQIAESICTRPTKAKPIVGVDAQGMTIVNTNDPNIPVPVLDALAVDAACSGNPGVMEYQGVYVATRTQLFHFKAPVGTNNIGEFLGIVHGLAYLKKQGLSQILYSDSVNAINWVKAKKCRTKLPLTPETAQLYDVIRRAEAWLHNNTYTTEIRKWDTDHWGEIPADFGRK